MSEDRLLKEDGNTSQCLSLGLVDSCRKGQANWELTALERKGEVAFRGHHLDARDEDAIACFRARDYGAFKDTWCATRENSIQFELGAVALPLGRGEVAKEHEHAANLEEELVRRELRCGNGVDVIQRYVERISVLPDIHVG